MVCLAALVTGVTAGCSPTDSSKAEECEQSPRRDPDLAFEATAQGGEAWALPIGPVPPSSNEDWKVVWRVTGEGDLRVEALDPDGVSHAPIAGPIRHDSSNFDRPGDEWGTFFRFTTPGCWELSVQRDAVAASVRLLVVE